MIAYRPAHERSRMLADRRQRPSTLRGLLRWAHAQYAAETPNLDHSGAHVDDDGAPTMAAAARAWLALSGRDEREDDWLRIASRCDADGFFLTPLRRTIETMPRERRLFLRDLAPELFVPSEIALLHGIPAWCASDVMHRSLSMLWDRFLERPAVTPGYLERSESQRAADDGGIAPVA